MIYLFKGSWALLPPRYVRDRRARRSKRFGFINAVRRILWIFR